MDLNLDLVSDNKDASSVSVQTISDNKDIGIQTHLSDFEKVVQANLSGDLRARADLLEFGSDLNLSIDSRELIEKAVQTKPDMEIDLNSIKPELPDASAVVKTMTDLNISIINQNVNITEWSNNTVFWASNKVTYMDILLQGISQ